MERDTPMCTLKITIRFAAQYTYYIGTSHIPPVYLSRPVPDLT